MTYTANGELSTKIDTSTGDTTSYTYSARGSLLDVTLPDGTLIEYIIDGEGRRIGKKVNGALTRGWLYKDDLRIAGETDPSGNVVAQFVYGGSPHSPDLMLRGGEVYRFIKDQLGSPRLVVNAASGEIAQQLEYDEFGRVLVDTNPGFQPFGFAGGLYDPDTGLVRFGARDYDAEVGRWTSKDPIRFEGDGPNLFSYALSDPINRLDPTGKSSADEACTACAACNTAAGVAQARCIQSARSPRVAAACALIRAGCVPICGICAVKKATESQGPRCSPPPPGCSLQGTGPGNPCRVICPNDCVSSPCKPQCGGP